jgi:hypothetical protein
MRKATQIVAATLTVAALGLLAAMPHVIVTWGMPAGQCIASVSTNPLMLSDPEAAMPLVAGQCTIAASSLKPPELMDDPGKQMIAEPTFIASLNGLCGFILMVEDGEVDAIVTWRTPAGQCIAPVSTSVPWAMSGGQGVPPTDEDRR